MKKQINKLVSLTLALMLLLGLTACGGDDKSEASSETRDPVADRVEAITGESGDGEDAAEAITLSDWLGSGETVWYVTDAPVSQLGKDTEVETILLLEPDGTAYAGNGGGATLGELAQMDEETLIQEAKDAYAKKAKPDVLRNFAEESNAVRMALINQDVFEYMMSDYLLDAGAAEDLLRARGFSEQLNTLMQRYIDTYQSYPDDQGILFSVIDVISNDGTDEILADVPNMDPENADTILALIDELYAIQDEIAEVLSADPQPGRWALGLNTDQTGNNVESMTFAWEIAKLEGAVIDDVTCYASSGAGQTVYDVLYGGVDLKSGALVTRVDGPYSVVLDGTDSGLPLDVEAEDLFS